MVLSARNRLEGNSPYSRQSIHSTNESPYTDPALSEPGINN